MNRNDFQQLARLRLEEAQALLEAGHYSGAYYLAGYAVECALKACIAKNTKAGDFPDRQAVNDSYTPDLEKLIKVAGLGEELGQLLGASRTFRLYWDVVNKWSPDSRYESKTEEQARELYLAITHSRQGILRWLRRNY